MTLKNFLFTGSVLVLCGCAAGQDFSGSHFWQRVSMSDAIYAQGPKAQTGLDRDIAQCVVDLREAGRSDELRSAIPENGDARDMNPDDRKMADWDTPDHEGSLLAEHIDYHDFDGCMKDKGWERTETMPFDTAQEARRNYYLANVNYGYDPAVGKPRDTTNDTSFSNLNE